MTIIRVKEPARGLGREREQQPTNQIGPTGKNDVETLPPIQIQGRLYSVENKQKV